VTIINPCYINVKANKTIKKEILISSIDRRNAWMTEEKLK